MAVGGVALVPETRLLQMRIGQQIGRAHHRHRGHFDPAEQLHPFGRAAVLENDFAGVIALRKNPRQLTLVNNQHGPDENLRLQNLWEGIEMLAALMTMPK